LLLKNDLSEGVDYYSMYNVQEFDGFGEFIIINFYFIWVNGYAEFPWGEGFCNMWGSNERRGNTETVGDEFNVICSWNL